MAQIPHSPIHACDVLRDVFAEMLPLADLRQVKVKLETGEEPATVSGNRPALRRLFLALLDNALKYSRAGGEVLLSVQRSDSDVAITIEDSGIGISEADLPHIFKRFYRANRARSGGGYGLGLSLAESIARAHGAMIDVRSVEGASSVFQVTFAAREANPPLLQRTFSFPQ